MEGGGGRKAKKLSPHSIHPPTTNTHCIVYNEFKGRVSKELSERDEGREKKEREKERKKVKVNVE